MNLILIRPWEGLAKGTVLEEVRMERAAKLIKQKYAVVQAPKKPKAPKPVKAQIVMTPEPEQIKTEDP